MTPESRKSFKTNLQKITRRRFFQDSLQTAILLGMSAALYSFIEAPETPSNAKSSANIKKPDDNTQLPFEFESTAPSELSSMQLLLVGNSGRIFGDKKLGYSTPVSDTYKINLGNKNVEKISENTLYPNQVQWSTDGSHFVVPEINGKPYRSFWFNNLEDINKRFNIYSTDGDLKHSLLIRPNHYKGVGTPYDKAEGTLEWFNDRTAILHDAKGIYSYNLDSASAKVHFEDYVRVKEHKVSLHTTALSPNKIRLAFDYYGFRIANLNWGHQYVKFVENTQIGFPGSRSYDFGWTSGVYEIKGDTSSKFTGRPIKWFDDDNLMLLDSSTSSIKIFNYSSMKLQDFTRDNDQGDRLTSYYFGNDSPNIFLEKKAQELYKCKFDGEFVSKEIITPNPLAKVSYSGLLEDLTFYGGKYCLYRSGNSVFYSNLENGETDKLLEIKNNENTIKGFSPIILPQKGTADILSSLTK